MIFLALLLAAAPESNISARVEKAGAQIITATFKDSDGEHRVVFTEQKLVSKKDKRSQQLTVLHEKKVKNAWVKVWDAKDFINDCEFDVTVQVLDKSITVTDLDADGLAEVSFMYQLGCRSDVSPLSLKLLMYEQTRKFALRGVTRVKVGEENGKDLEEGGTFEADSAFKTADKGFQPFAEKQWEQFKRP